MVKVLIIDDSLFMRTLISDCLVDDPNMIVHTAKSGTEALKIIPKLKPDCITLDLVLPGEDGLLVLKKIMNQYPTPVIVLSAYSQEGAEITFNCLTAGAVSFIPKPSGEISLDINKVKNRLREEIKLATTIQKKKLSHGVENKEKKAPPRQVMVMGASTGGPQAIEEILQQLPIDFPHAIFVVQHMPSFFFTEQFAKRLDQNCHLPVKVAKNGEVIYGKSVYLVPSSFRIHFKKGGPSHKQTLIQITAEQQNGLTPSIDAVMKSVASVWGEKAVGILLTGMGSDGLQGMRAIKKAGGRTIAQDESALIFGMPQLVIEAGLADEILPIDKMAENLMEGGGGLDE